MRCINSATDIEKNPQSMKIFSTWNWRRLDGLWYGWCCTRVGPIREDIFGCGVHRPLYPRMVIWIAQDANQLVYWLGSVVWVKHFPILHLQHDSVNLRLHLKLPVVHGKIDVRNSMGKMPPRPMKPWSHRLLQWSLMMASVSVGSYREIMRHGSCRMLPLRMSGKRMHGGICNGTPCHIYHFGTSYTIGICCHSPKSRWSMSSSLMFCHQISPGICLCPLIRVQSQGSCRFP